QTMGCPGRAIWKLLMIININGVSTRKPTTSSKKVIGSDGSRKKRIGGRTPLSKGKGFPMTCDLSLIFGPQVFQYTGKTSPSIVVCCRRIIHIRCDAFACEFGLISAPDFQVLVRVLDEGASLFD